MTFLRSQTIRCLAALAGLTAASGCGPSSEMNHVDVLAGAQAEGGPSPPTATQAAAQTAPGVLVGELIVPPGQSFVVSAPYAGVLAAPTGKPPLAVGAVVEARQPLLLLAPLVTPSERLRLAEARLAVAAALDEAERQRQEAQSTFDTARQQQKAADDLYREGVGSSRALEQANTQLSAAKSKLDAVEQKLLYLRDAMDLTAHDLPAQTITAPVSGQVLDVFVAPGQTVAAGERLFEVAQVDRLWVRVAFPASGAPPAQVLVRADAGPAMAGSAPAENATLVSVPEAIAGTCYALDNTSGHFRPGQRVALESPRAP